MKTEIVSMHDLKEGDTIRHYGATLKLSNRKDHGLHPYSDHTEEKHGSVITFDVERMTDEYGSFPKSWLDSTDRNQRYHLQGNRLATVARIIEE
jgi:hypothetical protein